MSTTTLVQSRSHRRPPEESLIQESLQHATVEQNTRQNTRRRSKLTLQHRSTVPTRNRPTYQEKNRSTVVKKIGRTTTTNLLWLHTPDITCIQRSMMKIMRRNKLQKVDTKKKQSFDAHPVPSIDTEEKPRRLKIMIDRYPHVHYNPSPVKKPQTFSRRITDPGIIAACHCGAEYEKEYSASIETHTATSIDSAHQKSTDIPGEESVDSCPEDWENDYYKPTLAAYTRHTMHTEEYDEDYEEERAAEAQLLSNKSISSRVSGLVY
ncbi:hypothetical protein F2Q70_00030181 [Brassica cretica]|uniref:Uncharacterized protein n=1 Tax=Brassica cretica TaxID=69181 RepID=A0A8S9FJJ5_BRACR|nr:hypothetical protein F2Q70_00030181 [Brassica cretica]